MTAVQRYIFIMGAEDDVNKYCIYSSSPNDNIDYESTSSFGWPSEVDDEK